MNKNKLKLAILIYSIGVFLSLSQIVKGYMDHKAEPISTTNITELR